MLHPIPSHARHALGNETFARKGVVARLHRNSELIGLSATRKPYGTVQAPRACQPEFSVPATLPAAV